MADEDLLYTNKFTKIPKNKELSPGQSKQYENYHLQKLSNSLNETALKKINLPPKPSSNSQNINKILNVPYIVNGRPTYQNPSKFKRERKTTIVVDSAFRNPYIFPSANYFVFDLPRSFLNVKSIALVSLEFPNVDRVVKDDTFGSEQNNLVPFITLNDGLISPYNDAFSRTPFEPYLPGIQSGNYNLSSINKQISNILNNNIVDYQNNDIFTFKTSVDLDRMVYTINSFNTKYTVKNPISTVQGSNIFSIYYVYQQSNPGDYIFLQGLSGVGGFSASQINGIFRVLYTEVNNISVRASSGIATQTLSFGGGAGIIGFQKEIQLSFSDYPNSLHTILGFPFENSSENLQDRGTPLYNIGLISKTLKANNVVPGILTTFYTSVVYSIVSITTAAIGVPITVTTSVPNSLSPGDNITIQDSNCTPTIDSNWIVNTVINSTNFTVLLNKKITSVGTYGKIICSTLDNELTSPIFLQIINITQPVAGIVEITTSTINNFAIGDTVIITGSNCTPSINGTYTVSDLINNPAIFRVKFSGTLLVNGTKGYIKIPGDTIQVTGLSSIPQIYSGTSIFEVLNSTPTSFQINFQTTSVDTDSFVNTIIGTNTIYVYQPNHGFNQITSVVDTGVDYPFNEVNITFKNPHNLYGQVFQDNIISVTQDPYDTNSVTVALNIPHNITTKTQRCIISQLSTDPILDGEYNYIEVVDSMSFKLPILPESYGSGPMINTTFAGGNTIYNSSEFVINNINTVSLDISSPVIDRLVSNCIVLDAYTIQIIVYSGLYSNGTRGILGVSNQFKLYRTTSNVQNSDLFAGIPMENINNSQFDVYKVIDENYYNFKLSRSYANDDIYTAGSNIWISSYLHGFKPSQNNTSDGSNLYAIPEISGDNYAYVTSTPNFDNILNNDTDINNIFGKILLNNNPNTVLFDSFIPIPLIYNDTPLPKLDQIPFQITKKDGSLYDFNNSSYSMSIEITEYIDSLDNTLINTKTGSVDNSLSVKSLYTSLSDIDNNLISQ